MFYLTLIFIVNIIYVIWSVVYYVREYLVKFKASDNGFLNIGAIISSAISMVASVSSALYANGANNTYDVLRNPSLYDAEYLSQARLQLPGMIHATFVNLGVAVIFFGIYALIRGFVLKEIKHNLEKPKKRWNWGKIE